MKTKEIRVGNLLYYTGLGGDANQPVEVFSMSAAGFIAINGKLSLPESRFNPIPLTEEWLTKFGFISEIKKTWFNFKPKIYFELYNKSTLEEGFVIVPGITQKTYFRALGKKIESVHQLQNLYFALTGEELSINEGD